jgi:hypothetical protein
MHSGRAKSKLGLELYVTTYIIGYDLNKPGHDYAGLIAAIKSMFAAWWHYLDSTWIVRSDKTAVQIRDALKGYLDPSDEMLVADLSGTAAWVGFPDNGSDWLKSNLS